MLRCSASCTLTHCDCCRSYAPLVAGRDVFGDKSKPPGPGLFTGTFDFASPPVRPAARAARPRAMRRG